MRAVYAALPKTGKPQPHEHTVLAGNIRDSIVQATIRTSRATAAHPCCVSHVHTAGIVAYSAAASDDNKQTQMRVVAIGTGTKCLGGSKRSPTGDLLNDSHAEVIARRAFMAWVYQQLHHAAQQPQQQGPSPATDARRSLPCEQPACQPPPCHAAPAGSSRGQVHSKQQPAFTWSPQTRKFVLRPGVQFAMYVSQPPCGDASIFGAAAGGGPQQAQEEEAPPVGAPTAAAKGQQQQAIGRTGAKVLRPLGAADVAQAAAAAAAATVGHELAQPAQQEQVAVVPSVPTAQDVEAGPQQLGVLRRKPGKGDPTLSLSCSDKLARWACLGLQGSLLCSLLQEPLYLSMLVVSVPGGSSSGEQQQPSEQGAAVGAAQQERQGSREQQQGGAGGAAGCAASSSCPQEPQSAQQQVSPSEAADLLAAVEAAGARAFGQRLAACAGVLRPPFRLVRPKVVAVQAADLELGLQPGGQRVAASGEPAGWLCCQVCFGQWGVIRGCI